MEKGLNTENKQLDVQNKGLLNIILKIVVGFLIAFAIIVAIQAFQALFSI